MRFRILLLFILLMNLVHAQESVNYFSDSLKTGSNSRIFCAEMRNGFIYAGGQSFDSLGKPYTPSLIKLDTSGKTIWTYTLNKQIDTVDYDGNSFYKSGYIINLVIDSTDVYADMYTPFFGREIRKINQVTGEEIWKKRAPAYPSLLKNAGSNYIICTYNESNSVYGYVYSLIDKVTGETVMTKLLNTVTQEFTDGAITIEADGVTYISHGDSLLAYTSPMLSAVKWAVKTNAPGAIHVIEPNSDGYIYIAGSGTFPGQSFFSGRIKKLNGEADWIAGSNLVPWLLDDYVSDFKIKGNYVYTSGQQSLVGSVYTSYHICKYERNTGKLIWETNYNPFSTPPGPGDPYAGINSIVVDENDNVYANGYEYADDKKSGIWGICKFDAAGNLAYHTQLLDGFSNTEFSRGVLSFELNHRIFHLGELQKNASMPDQWYNPGYSNVFLVATDTSSSFNPYNKQRIFSTYQEFSEVRQIEPFSTSKYLVYKKTGNHAVVEMKNAKDNAVIWSRSFNKGFHSEADKICVTADNNIYISMLRYPAAEMQFDFSVYADSVYFIKLDSTGAFLKETKYSIAGQRKFKSLQLYPAKDTNTVFIFKNLGWNNQEVINFFNIEKATVPLLDGSTSFYSTHEPSITNQSFLVPLTNDTYAAVQNRFYDANSSSGPLLYEVSFKNNQGGFHSGAGYDLPKFSIIYEKVRAHYVLPHDSTSIIILGTDYLGTGEIFLYNKNLQSNVWMNTLPASNYLDMATIISDNIFATGRSGNSLLLQKLNASTGSLIWQKNIAPANNNQYYIPVEQKFNTLKNQYVISGFITDSANATFKQSAFYIITDSSGTIISKWVQPGDYRQQNTLKAIGITPHGQTIIGGALYKYPYGRSGVLIEADSAIVPIDSTTNPVDSTIVPADNIITINAEVVAKNKAEINWEVTPENNVDYYEVQHSVDGSNFETLGTQQAVPGSSGNNTYIYTTGTLGDGTHYFRIRLVDSSGNTQYSDTINLQLVKRISTMHIAPNPAQSQILIQLPEAVQNITFLIYNAASGKVVKKMTNMSGSNITCDISNLPPGIYIIKTAGSETVYVGKFMKL